MLINETQRVQQRPKCEALQRSVTPRLFPKKIPTSRVEAAKQNEALPPLGGPFIYTGTMDFIELQLT